MLKVKPASSSFGHDAREVVRPVQRDRHVAGEQRGLGDVDDLQVARLLQRGEVLDAGHDVVERAAVGQRRRDDGGERRARLTRIAVERDLALVLGLGEVGPRLRRVGHEGAVAADRHDAVVGADPVAVGVLRGRRGSRPSWSSCTASMRPSSMACWVNDGPMSMESGLSGWPCRVWMAVSSSADDASGLATGCLEAVRVAEGLRGSRRSWPRCPAGR